MAIVPVKFTDEFKRDAVALVDSGIAQKQVCKDLGISKSALQAWVRDARFEAHGMTPSTDPDEQRKMAAAMKRIRELEMENEVLRRAAAYLSQARIHAPRMIYPLVRRDGHGWCPYRGAGRGAASTARLGRAGPLPVADRPRGRA